MFKFIIQAFVTLLRFSGSLAAKCICLNNEPCLSRLTLSDFTNLNLKELHCYLFMVSLDRCNGSFNTLHDLSRIICFPNKTEDVNLNVFNMITRINESKTITKQISCGFKCKFNGRKCISNQN